MAKILLVHEDGTSLNPLVQLLHSGNHIIEHVKSGREALARMQGSEFKLAILDCKLPDMRGIDACTLMRDQGSHLPILFLTEIAKISERVNALDSGADDCLFKPYAMQECAARVRSLLRRPRDMYSRFLEVGAIKVDSATRSVTKKGRALVLRNHEYAVLEYLLRRKNQVISIEMLLNDIWSSVSEATDDAVRHCIMRVRKKIDCDNKSVIITVKRLGYTIAG